MVCYTRSEMFVALIILAAALVVKTQVIYESYCEEGLFRCSNGDCIQHRQFCDGRYNCPDKSDEAFCVKEFYQSCPTSDGVTWNVCENRRRCYPAHWRCDGNRDCPDGSDEKDCSDFGMLVNKESKANKISQNTLTQSLLNIKKSQRSINKWGPDLPRIAMALYLSDSKFFEPTNQKAQEMAYEISLQLLSKLALKKKIETHELSLYVNSLLVSCIDPRNFFGIDVMAELRNRVDSSNYTNPFTILTLCNAKDDMTEEDVRKVLGAFDAQHRHVWTDIQALATMALTCLSTRTNLSVNQEDITKMVKELKRKQHKNGTVENLTSTALVAQVLLSTGDWEDFNFEEAMKLIRQNISSGQVSTLDSYYILPVLSFKSLLNISNEHCEVPDKTDRDILLNLRNNQDERIQVQYSMYIGDDMDFIRTWKLKVPTNYTFYNVLENIAALEPEYKVLYNVHEGKPYVRGVSKMVEDAEGDMYWFICKQTLGSSEVPHVVKGSPVDMLVDEDEEFILWYRSGSWVSK